MLTAAHHRAMVDVDALKVRCRAQLSGYKRPTEIHVLESLPKTAVGKLDKRSLLGQLPRAAASVVPTRHGV